MPTSIHKIRFAAVAAVVSWFSIGPFLNTGIACTSFVQETHQGTVLAANLDLGVPADGTVVINRRGVAKENFRKGIDGKTMKWVSKYGSISFNTAGRGFA